MWELNSKSDALDGIVLDMKLKWSGLISSDDLFSIQTHSFFSSYFNLCMQAKACTRIVSFNRALRKRRATTIRPSFFCLGKWSYERHDSEFFPSLAKEDSWLSNSRRLVRFYTVSSWRRSRFEFSNVFNETSMEFHIIPMRYARRRTGIVENYTIEKAISNGLGQFTHVVHRFLQQVG